MGYYIQNQLSPTASCYNNCVLYWQAGHILYRNIWSRMNISPLKGVLYRISGHPSDYVKKLFCTKGSYGTSFLRSRLDISFLVAKNKNTKWPQKHTKWPKMRFLR